MTEKMKERKRAREERLQRFHVWAVSDFDFLNFFLTISRCDLCVKKAYENCKLKIFFLPGSDTEKI